MNMNDVAKAVTVAKKGKGNVTQTKEVLTKLSSLMLNEPDIADAVLRYTYGSDYDKAIIALKTKKS